MTERKSDHIELAANSRLSSEDMDRRFSYEPVLSGHPNSPLKPKQFLGKLFHAPIWISSMTGGTAEAGHINKNLARLCKEFKLGMGLGSCRTLLNSNKHFNDFNLRDLVGPEQAFYANLGIAQIEQLISNDEITKIEGLIRKLQADGLIIHINPMQEWLQPEGDRIKHPPLETIKTLLNNLNFPIIVKEIGQGMGLASLQKLMQLPLAAIEFGAFGGTNFSKLESMRSDRNIEINLSLSKLGHDAFEMTGFINQIVEQGDTKCKEVIISGGISSFLDGYYLINKCKLNSIYGQASALLPHARKSYESLKKYMEQQIESLQLAYSFLQIK